MGEEVSAPAPPALRRLPIFLLGAVSLIAGLLAGLARLGLGDFQPWLHGPAMVSGFFGVVIGLERAVALRRPWAYGAPILTGLGGLAFLAGLPFAQALFVLGSGLFLLVGLYVVKLQRALFTAMMALGAAAWLTGNLLWLAGRTIHDIVPFWMAFLLLTIGGERLELSRFLPPTPLRRATIWLPLGAILIAQGLAGFGVSGAPHPLGFSFFAFALWLAHYDIARRTVKQKGLTRYMAICLLSGYFWLALSGLLALIFGLPAGGPVYDAILHGFFIGFVFAMVFGHAPVILPAVLKVDLPYRPVLYAPLAILHGSMLLRLFGDMHDFPFLRAWGGAANAAAILLFLAVAAGSVILKGRARLQ